MGKAQLHRLAAVLDFTAAADYLAGDVVQLVCGLAGVLIADTGNGVTGPAQASGIFKIQKVSGAIAAGADVFWDANGSPYGGTALSGAVTGTAASGDFYLGKAERAALSTATHVYVALNREGELAPAQTKTIWVDGDRQDPYVEDGSQRRPYKDLESAWAVLSATRNILRVAPATYSPVATLSLPAHDVTVTGEGANDSVIIAAAAAAIFTKSAGALTATTTYRFKNLMLEHGDTYKGILIDNTSATKKIIVAVENCEFGGAANAIDVATHGDADNAVRVVVNNGGMEIEGPVNFAIGNDGDYLRISDAVLSGGLVTGTSATVSEITLRNCEVLHEGVTGGATEQVLNVISCHSRTGATIAAFDTSDAAGSHTENILAV